VQKHTEIVAHVNKALAVTDFEADLTKFATYKISIHHFSDASQKFQIVTKISAFHIHSTFIPLFGRL
jgi:hypothetical protein